MRTSRFWEGVGLASGAGAGVAVRCGPGKRGLRKISTGGITVAAETFDRLIRPCVARSQGPPRVFSVDRLLRLSRAMTPTGGLFREAKDTRS